MLPPDFFGCREAWKDTRPRPWDCSGGCFMQQPPDPWHGGMVPVAFPGPCGFSGSEALRRAEMHSSCLSDPQVKDEDKSLAVKRPGKEDGAVSVAGHGQGGAVSGMGLALGGDRPCDRAWGHHGGLWAQHSPPHPPRSLGSTGGHSKAACGGWRVFSAGMPRCQCAAISPPPPPQGLSLPCTPRRVSAHPTVTVPAPVPLSKTVGGENLAACPPCCREVAGALDH